MCRVIAKTLCPVLLIRVAAATWVWRPHCPTGRVDAFSIYLPGKKTNIEFCVWRLQICCLRCISFPVGRLFLLNLSNATVIRQGRIQLGELQTLHGKSEAWSLS